MFKKFFTWACPSLEECIIKQLLPCVLQIKEGRQNIDLAPDQEIIEGGRIKALHTYCSKSFRSYSHMSVTHSISLYTLLKVSGLLLNERTVCPLKNIVIELITGAMKFCIWCLSCEDCFTLASHHLPLPSVSDECACVNSP